MTTSLPTRLGLRLASSNPEPAPAFAQSVSIGKVRKAMMVALASPEPVSGLARILLPYVNKTEKENQISLKTLESRLRWVLPTVLERALPSVEDRARSLAVAFDTVLQWNLASTDIWNDDKVVQSLLPQRRRTARCA